MTQNARLKNEFFEKIFIKASGEEKTHNEFFLPRENNKFQSVDQLDERHLRSVTAARSELVYLSISAVAILVLRRYFREEL